MYYTLLGIDINNHFTYCGHFWYRKDAEKYIKELNYHKYALFYSVDKRVEIDQDDDLLNVERRRDEEFEVQKQKHELKKQELELKHKEIMNKEFNDFINSDRFTRLSHKEQEQIKRNMFNPESESETSDVSETSETSEPEIKLYDSKIYNKIQ